MHARLVATYYSTKVCYTHRTFVVCLLLYFNNIFLLHCVRSHPSRKEGEEGNLQDAGGERPDVREKRRTDRSPQAKRVQEEQRVTNVNRDSYVIH